MAKAKAAKRREGKGKTGNSLNHLLIGWGRSRGTDCGGLACVNICVSEGGCQIQAFYFQNSGSS